MGPIVLRQPVRASQRRVWIPIAKWASALFTLVIFVVIAFSFGKQVKGSSADCSKFVEIAGGGLTIWGPTTEAERLKVFAYGPLEFGSSHYPPFPEGRPKFIWWIRIVRDSLWPGFQFPLWMPLVLSAALATWLFWLDRRATAQAWRRYRAWATPLARTRVSILRGFIFTIIHLAAVFVITGAVLSLTGFFNRQSWFPTLAAICRSSTNFPINVFTWPSPLWGLLWSYLVVRWQNKLLASYPDSCHECGYNMTGNVSGRCPECGSAATNS